MPPSSIFDNAINDVVSILSSNYDRLFDKNSVLVMKTCPQLVDDATLLVAVYESGFSTESIGLNSGLGVTTLEKDIRLSGDGIKKVFSITEKYVGPFSELIVDGKNIVSFRGILGKKDSSGDRRTVLYQFDADSRKISFKTPPMKGRDNIRIKFQMPSKQISGLRLHIGFIIEVVARNRQNCNLLAEEVMKRILASKNQRHLSDKGIKIGNPIGSRLLSNSDSTSKKETFSRKLYYQMVVDLKIEEEGLPISGIIPVHSEVVREEAMEDQLINREAL